MSVKVLSELLYSKDHEWARVDGDKAYIGVTDYAQNALGSIVFVDLPVVGDEFSSGDVFGAIESVKAASDVFCPISGTVTEVNEELMDNPEDINEDPYSAWLICVELSNKDELEDLMTPKEYKDICTKED